MVRKGSIWELLGTIGVSRSADGRVLRLFSMYAGGIRFVGDNACMYKFNFLVGDANNAA